MQGAIVVPPDLVFDTPAKREAAVRIIGIILDGNQVFGYPRLAEANNPSLWVPDHLHEWHVGFDPDFASVIRLTSRTGNARMLRAVLPWIAYRIGGAIISY